ncbi:MAG TPA: hemerythrin domain-containing protein [Kofleriaceae bacterium]|nr:hemerythrin domain-containing protein [Kofleriaceae bacterium]
MSPSPKQVLTELLEQHEEIRGIIDHCEQMADQLDAGQLEPQVLLSEVARLRVVFDVHNRFEERLLRPILRDIDAFGSVRIDKMVEDHVGEHRAMREGLDNPITAELRSTLAKLRQHLATEERFFLSSKVLREDIVVVEGGG